MMTNDTGFLQEREADMKGRRQLAALKEVEANFDNIRESWRWAVRQKNHTAVNAMLEGLYWFCRMRNRWQEGQELFQLARAGFAPQPGEDPHPVWGKLLVRFADTRNGGEDAIETALALARQQEDKAEIAFCVLARANAAHRGKDFAGAIPVYREALAQYTALDDSFYSMYALLGLGTSYANTRQHEAAVAEVEKCLELARATGHRLMEAQALNELGAMAFLRGDYAGYDRRVRESYALHREIDNPHGAAWTGVNTAWTTCFQGDFAGARRIADEALAFAAGFEDAMAKGSAQILHAYIALAEEDYAESKRFVDAVLPTMQQHSMAAPAAHSIAAFAACGLEDYATARAEVVEALKGIAAIGLLPVIPPTLATAMLVLAQDGQLERAVEIGSLGYNHPLSFPTVRDRFALFNRVRDRLQSQLGEPAFQAAWERGKTLNLETVAQELVAEFASA